MTNRIDDTMPMNELPTWLQELWELNSALARRAEKQYLELKIESQKSTTSTSCIDDQKRLLNPFASYMVKNYNPNDGKTSSDYVEEWLSI